MTKTNNAIRLIEFKRGTQYRLWLLSITLTFSQQWWNNLLGNTWVRNNFLNWILYLDFKSSHINHRTIIPTGITFKKTPCYMRNSARRWLIVENAKIFRSYVKHFLVFQMIEIVKSWLVCMNKFSWIIQSCYLTKTTKQS